MKFNTHYFYKNLLSYYALFIFSWLTIILVTIIPLCNQLNRYEVISLSLTLLGLTTLSFKQLVLIKNVHFDWLHKLIYLVLAGLFLTSTSLVDIFLVFLVTISIVYCRWNIALWITSILYYFRNTIQLKLMKKNDIIKYSDEISLNQIKEPRSNILGSIDDGTVHNWLKSLIEQNPNGTAVATATFVAVASIGLYWWIKKARDPIKPGRDSDGKPTVNGLNVDENGWQQFDVNDLKDEPINYLDDDWSDNQNLNQGNWFTRKWNSLKQWWSGSPPTSEAFIIIMASTRLAHILIPGLPWRFIIRLFLLIINYFRKRRDS